MATLQPGEKSRMYALGGVARGGAVRGGYVSSRVFLTVGGDQIGFLQDDPTVGTIARTLTISESLGADPNTCAFRLNGAVPAVGGEVRLTFGTKNRTAPQFAGFLTGVQQIYGADNPRHIQADCSCVDYAWLLGFTLVTQAYVALPADVIALDLIARFAAAHGFSGAAVAPGLPTVPEITFTNEEFPQALSRLADRIGGYWYVDYQKIIHLFLTEQTNGDPVPLTYAHKSLAHVVQGSVRTQALARVFVEGRGARLLAPIAAGETRLPVEAIGMFDARPGVFLKVARQGAVGGGYHLTFTGTVRGGEGSLVGSGVGPTTAPSLALAGAGSIETGTHHYAVTFTTASGETLPSPVATIDTGGVPNPTAPGTNLRNVPDGTPFDPSYIAIGDAVSVAYAYSTGTTTANARDAITKMSTEIQPPLTVVSNNDPLNPTRAAPTYCQIPYTTDPRVTFVVVYLWTASQSAQGQNWGVSHIEPNRPDLAAQGSTLTAVFRTYSDPVAMPPSATNTTAQTRVTVSAIPVGAATVLSRTLYRSAANTSPLKLLATIADNTTTTYADGASDTTLGANAPTGDTSGLKQPDGVVLPGATALPVASLAGFSAEGGWAVIGNGEQVIRYSGTATAAGVNSLWGIPAAGLIGSIRAAVAHNSTVTAAHLLTGIPPIGAGSLTGSLAEGDEVYAVTTVENATVQGALAAMPAGTGWREEWVQDRRLSLDEAQARGLATLALRPLDAISFRYTCRDLRTAPGKIIHVDLAAPTNLHGDFRIQRVQIDNFRPHPIHYPTYTVEASSSLFSFEDWLRRMRVSV